MNTCPFPSYFQYFTRTPLKRLRISVCHFTQLPCLFLPQAGPNFYSASIYPCLFLHFLSFLLSSLYPQHLQKPPYSCTTSVLSTVIASKRSMQLFLIPQAWIHRTDSLDEETPFTIWCTRWLHTEVTVVVEAMQCQSSSWPTEPLSTASQYEILTTVNWVTNRTGTNKLGARL